MKSNTYKYNILTYETFHVIQKYTQNPIYSAT